MNDLWFVTFGDPRLTQARKRIRRQAEKMGVFDSRIRILSETDLDADFRERMGSHLIPGSRGFGYWCWKPQVVLQTLREMKNGDVLLYADIGCHLNPRGLKRLEEYRQLAIKHGLVAFQSRARCPASETDRSLHFLYDRHRTKMDLLKYFAVDGNLDLLDSGIVGAGAFLVKKCNKGEVIITQWRQCYYDNFALADDSPSVSSNFPGFVANSHDQSIFSILCKKYGACLLSCGEYVRIRAYMPENGDKSAWPDYWRELKDYPVLAKRDLGKYTKFVECPDWLKPILGKTGRRLASKTYEYVKRFLCR